MTYIVGIDCATNGTRVGLALGYWDGNHLHLKAVEKGTKKLSQQVLSFLPKSGEILLAMDAPLGWPDQLGAILAKHQAGAPLDLEANHLFRRETDRFIKSHFNKQSLDVGADRIARTAHAALHLLQIIRNKTRNPFPFLLQPNLGQGTGVIEVYPAATLIAHQMPSSGYKDKTAEHVAKRQQIIAHLKNHMTVQCDAEVMLDCADVLDAALCVLAGSDFLNGRCYPPENLERAQKESWIWAKRL